MTDIKRALLGDHEAAKRLAQSGIVIPCPICGGVDCCISDITGNEPYVPERWSLHHFCKGIEAFISTYGSSAVKCIETWNTRAPILSAEEMERLEATNEHDAS